MFIEIKKQTVVLYTALAAVSPFSVYFFKFLICNALC